jgi:hypothetical protein
MKYQDTGMPNAMVRNKNFGRCSLRGMPSISRGHQLGSFNVIERVDRSPRNAIATLTATVSWLASSFASPGCVYAWYPSCASLCKMLGAITHPHQPPFAQPLLQQPEALWFIPLALSLENHTYPPRLPFFCLPDCFASRPNSNCGLFKA